MRRRGDEATRRRFFHRITASSHHRLLLPLTALLTLAGYVGPWVPHEAAGLVVTGLDLGEYVKFLHPVRSGEIDLWREGFYLPLIAVSVTLSLWAFRRELGYPWIVRVALLLVAAVAALNLLPPAWSPALLLTPEFRLQTAGLVICLGLAAFSPFLALLPRRLAAIIVLVLTVAALWLPVHNFLRLLPTIGELYRQPLVPGWGVWAMGVGLVGMGGVVGLILFEAFAKNRGARPEGTRVVRQTVDKQSP